MLEVGPWSCRSKASSKASKTSSVTVSSKQTESVSASILRTLMPFATAAAKNSSAFDGVDSVTVSKNASLCVSMVAARAAAWNQAA